MNKLFGLLITALFTTTLYAASTGPASLTTPQVANTVLAGPTTGGNALATFRALVPTDLGTGTSISTKFLRGDGVYTAITAGDAQTANPLSQFASTTSLQLAGVLSDETGTGSAVFSNAPTLTTPVLGVASATSINKVAITAPATSATLTVADGKTLTASNTLTFTGTDGSSVAFGTGGTATYTSNNLGAFSATTSSQLAGVLSDETGTGSAVFSNAPTLVTPVLGVASATTINKVTITAPASASTLTVADGSSLITSGANSLTLTTTATTNATFPSGSFTVASAPSVTNQTSNVTLTSASTFWQTNNGAAGSVAFTLPTAAAGLFYDFVMMTNQTVTVTAAGADKIYYGQINTSGATVITCAEQFASWRLLCTASGKWVVVSTVGSVTIN